MDNPECTLLSLVKIEEEGKEMKEEPINEGDDMEYVQVEDTLSLEESSSEQDMAEMNDTVNGLVSFSEGDMTGPLNFSKFDAGTRRRLRFSESDDMVLLRNVAALNPYKSGGLWKEVTHMVALKAGKNFSVRSIRDHTDLLMNTFSLRGVETCLKRTPPELWEKKKQLLQMVHEMWKKHSYQCRSGASGANGANKSGTDATEAPRYPSRTSKSVYTEPPSMTNWLSLKSSSSRHSGSSASRMSSVPLLMQQPNVPFTLHLGTAVQSLACPPLLSGSSHSSLQPLTITSQAELQNLSPRPGFSPPVLESLPSSHRRSPSGRSDSAPDLVTDTMSSDKPVSLTTDSSLASYHDSTASQMVDRCTSPIPSIDCSGKEKISVSTQSEFSEKISVSTQNDVPNSSLTASVDSSTGNANTELRCLDWRTNERRRRIRKISSIMRLRMDFLRERHRNQFSLKRRELAIERRKIALEERKLILDERKVQLEEEKWQFDKREREEKLSLMTEEREHKMAMERRQQNMIDILLELKKKD